VINGLHMKVFCSDEALRFRPGSSVTGPCCRRIELRCPIPWHSHGTPRFALSTTTIGADRGQLGRNLTDRSLHSRRWETPRGLLVDQLTFGTRDLFTYDCCLQLLIPAFSSAERLVSPEPHDRQTQRIDREFVVLDVFAENVRDRRRPALAFQFAMVRICEHLFELNPSRIWGLP
jgi:hypothetical protein